MLLDENGSFVRQDIAAEHWSGPPKEFFGWWKSTVKHVVDTPEQRVPGETLLSLFERLATLPEPDHVYGEDTLYILTLLLLRRKLLRYEKEMTNEQEKKLLEVYSLQTNMTYQVPVAMPSRERLEAIQQQLTTWGY